MIPQQCGSLGKRTFLNYYTVGNVETVLTTSLDLRRDTY